MRFVCTYLNIFISNDAFFMLFFLSFAFRPTHIFFSLSKHRVAHERKPHSWIHLWKNHLFLYVHWNWLTSLEWSILFLNANDDISLKSGMWNCHVMSIKMLNCNKPTQLVTIVFEPTFDTHLFSFVHSLVFLGGVN